MQMFTGPLFYTDKTGVVHELFGGSRCDDKIWIAANNLSHQNSISIEPGGINVVRHPRSVACPEAAPAHAERTDVSPLQFPNKRIIFSCVRMPWLFTND